jgi:hypothetical protein
MPARVGDSSETTWRAHALAAGVYLGVALWAMRAVLPAPATTLPYAAALDRYETPLIEHNEYRFTQIEKDDQQFVVSVLAHHARALPTAPWTLFDPDHCHPMANALTLGEHMLGAGLLAVVPWALTRDPILTYNAVVILALWLPALAMYALVHHWTRSASAAFVAGLLFAFHPDRVFYPAHPFIHGNQWTPLALLFAARLFERRRWRDAAGLALFVGLQILESPYQLLAFAILGGVYGAWLVVRNVRALPSLAPKLLAVAGCTIAVLAGVFGPYLRTRATWPGLLRSQDEDYPLSLHAPGDLLPGGGAYAGSVALALAAVALLDRLRGARPEHGHDPRLVYLVAGLLVAWTVVSGVEVPWLGVSLPSPLVLARRVVPGVEALRVPVLARLGVHLVAAFLAGWGVLALVEKRSRTTRWALTGLLAAAAFAEVFHAPAAEWAFRHPVDMSTYVARPAAEDLELYHRSSRGVVLDVPVGRLLPEAPYLFLQAFHRRPVGACYNSFLAPLQLQVIDLAAGLPGPGAADALAALGFGTVVVHTDRMTPAAVRRFLHDRRSSPQSRARLTPLGSTPRLLAYRLASPTPTSGSFGLLADGAGRTRVMVSPPEAWVAFTFTNRGDVTFRHPDPLEPSDLVVRWLSAADGSLRERRIRGMLPIALGAGSTLQVGVPVRVPRREGVYDVTLARAAAPDTVLARQSVLVVRAERLFPPSRAR